MDGPAKVALEELETAVEEFCKAYVVNPQYRPRWPKEAKIIHDTIWGTIRLEPWEIALLDLPLLQRLRQIRQTSLVNYVFPGCNHTRFDHTLGVLQQTQRLIDAVNMQFSNSTDYPFDTHSVRDLRLAALFHDTGHSCFSHISENLFQFCPDMVAVTSADGQYPDCHAHEVLSTLILSSSAVCDYLRELESYYRSQGLEFRERRAAGWILGIAESNDKRFLYQAQVINGPFDADKLDYLFRDSHNSGLPLGLDLERLWASCKVETHGDTGSRILTLHQSSATPLEQIMFNKINLFTVVYQHPKVRAAECMFEGVLNYLEKTGEGIQGRKLEKASDYLWITDESFFSEALRRPEDDQVHRMIHQILYRRLLLRAITISADTVEAKDGNYFELRRLNQRGSEARAERRELAKQIWEEAKKPCPLEHIWVDLPADPPTGGADQTYVRTSAGKLRRLSDLFPIHYWSNLYVSYKWRGHVFCPAECQQLIYKTTREVFKTRFNLDFKISAGEASHVLGS